MRSTLKPTAINGFGVLFDEQQFSVEPQLFLPSIRSNAAYTILDFGFWILDCESLPGDDFSHQSA
jgi:hypothetical protein